ncbi:MAG: hypothetical protein WAQ57_02445 [Candidatus Saccharimonadales bacterium]
MFIRNLKAQIDTYVQNKTWYWYVPVWLFGWYLFINLLSFDLGGDMPFIISIAYGANFILHEAAHLATAFLPDILVSAAGSAAELLLGMLLIIIGIRGKTYFASLFGFLWFMLATQSVADYIADARTQALPLVSFGGGDPMHDWNFILGELGLLGQEAMLAAILRAVGIAVGLFGLVFSGWIIYKIAAAKPAPQMSNDEAQLLHETAQSKGLHAAPPEHFKQVKGDLYPTAYKGPLAAPNRTEADKPETKGSDPL